MVKYSQSELVNEAFKDIIKGSLKAAGRGAIGLTKGIAKTISPTGAALLGKAADKIGTAYANILGSSPTTALKSFLATPEGRRLYKSVNIGRETSLPNGDRMVEMTGEYMDPKNPSITKQIKTSPIFIRTDKGGLDPIEWKLDGQFDVATGEFVQASKTKTKQGKANKQAPVDINTKNKPSAAASKPKAGTRGTNRKFTGGVDQDDLNTAKAIGKGAVTAGKAAISGAKKLKSAISDRTQKQSQSKKQPAAKAKPKFYQALTDWKTKNIGPEASKVGVTYDQLKAFLQTLNIKDADKVLKSAGIQSGGKAISNKLLSGVEATLKSRGIVSETTNNTLSQRDLLFLLK